MKTGASLTLATEIVKTWSVFTAPSFTLRVMLWSPTSPLPGVPLRMCVEVLKVSQPETDESFGPDLSGAVGPPLDHKNSVEQRRAEHGRSSDLVF